MNNIPTINEIDNNSPSQDSKDVVVSATVNQPQTNEVEETGSAKATIEEIDATRKPTISEIYQIINDGLFEATTNWWDYSYKLSQAQINQDIISRLDKGIIGGGYNKPGVDIITTTSDKAPTNANVYSALKSNTLYPKKLDDENISGVYDFLNGVTIGKFTESTGARIYPDTYGYSHLDVDYLNVRLKAIFETLQILDVETIGGKMVISPAGSIRIAYVNTITKEIDGLTQDVYRCYFLGEQDGNEIDNKWKVGDQAQAKSFNIKKGTYHKVGNHYLWRLVVGVSEEPVEINGNKYHYVELSDIDCATGSDIPQPGDVLNQLGYRGDDVQRQSALVFSAVDGNAPSITLYAGIDNFTLLNKEYVEYGVYQGKAFFNVYGDMYIGDKGINPTTYIKFKGGKLDIKANLDIGSSIDGKNLNQYIKENGGVDEDTVISIINDSQVIKDLQNQVDGAIETWFYEGEPTLKNLPASNWTTTELKESHIGDLYYDHDTGFAYRFTKYTDDNNPYAWDIIKDTDIATALKAANAAQATADSKMKIFYGETKPTNYQAGDMWVNATLAGKFNNDIARSTTDSKTFDANHWVLASRYSESIQTLLEWSNDYTTKFDNLIEVVEKQKDQSISNWFYDYPPTLNNEPASLWNDEEIRSEHIGDIFYDIENNHSYRWTGSAWIMIKDADFDEAMKTANDAAKAAGDANDLADKKRQIFYSAKTPEGADRGDLWMKQVDDKTEVWIFDGTNWVKSNDKDLAKYSEAINKQLEGIIGQIDGKAETWYQADDPSNSWTNKTSHEGDIWYNTKNGTTQYWNGTSWEIMDIPKDIFNTINGKSSIFVDSYTDAKAGKGAISNGYKERDIWILPDNATINGVEYYQGDILTATADDTVFNEKHWIKKVRYVGNEELNKVIDNVNAAINNITATTLPGLSDKFNAFAKDEVIDSSEKARLTDLLNQANNEVLAINDQITSVTKSSYLKDNNANKGKLIEAQKALSDAWDGYNKLITTIITSSDIVTKTNIADASTKYTNLQNAIKAVKQYLAVCQADILSTIGTDINTYQYLKEAFKGKTEINGGLVVTNVLQLRQTSDSNSPITAGISGLQGKANADGLVDKDTYDITSIAAWFGGPMVDKDIFTNEQLANKVAGTDYARSLFRHDGSGYLASGAIYWGTDGVLHGDPNSFILQGTSFATVFMYTRLFYLHYTNNGDTGFNNIDYITPKKTFSRLDILSLGGAESSSNLPTGLFIGDSTTGGSFQIGNIIIRTNSKDSNILEIVSATDGKTAHLGVQGGISAYGTYTSSTGGGGIIGTVIPYTKAINITSTDESINIASAYSIARLSSRIDNISDELSGLNLSWDNITGKPTTYTPSSHTHNYTSTIKIGSTSYNVSSNVISIPAYPTTLPASDVYAWAKASTKPSYNWSEITNKPSKLSDFDNDVGYTINKGTVTSIGLSVPTGFSVSGSPITVSGTITIAFATGYSIPTTTKQNHWDTAYTNNHTHNNKSTLDGISSTKVSNWDSAYDWYTLMTTDETEADGVINKWNEVVSFLKNISQTDTLSGIINGINGSISANASNIKTLQSYFTSGKANDSDKLDGVHLNGLFTSFGNNNNTITATIGGITKTFTVNYATKANQLYTSRSLWGNNFNGTAAINGSITIVNTDGVYIQIGGVRLVYDKTNAAIKVVQSDGTTAANLYTTGSISAYGIGSTSGGSGFNGSVLSLSSIRTTTLNDTDYTKIPNAAALKNVDSRLSTIETNGATSISVTGTGNAVTSVSKNGTIITFDKGSTFSLSSHTHTFDSLTGKPTTLSGYGITDAKISNGVITLGGNSITPLTSHQSLSNYVTTSDSRLNDSRYPKFANNTWYIVGDDAYIGDHNLVGCFCIKSANSDNVSGISLWNKAQTDYATIWFDNTNLNINKQLVVANKRIWIQGNGTNGGNNNRLTLVSGMPSGLVYNTNCRGTILYSNGIAFADPYNGNSNNDSGWIRHLETTTNKGLLEIAVGDNNLNEEIHFRWYDTTSTSEHIGNDIIVPRATGTLALTSQIPTNLNQLSNGPGYVTGSVSGNTITINGTSTTWQNTWREITDSYSSTSTSVSLSQKGANDLYNALNSAKLNLSGGTLNGMLYFPNVSNKLCYGIQWTCGDSDFARIRAGATASNAGYLEIATADDATEPIYIRQYGGTFTSLVRTLTLLDANGYSYFPSYINIGGNEGNNSSPNRVWGSNGSDTFLRSYLTSALNVNYASSAGNADTVDGYHESSFLRYRGFYDDASVTKDGVGVYGWDHTNAGHNNFHESYGDIINIQGYSSWRTRFDIGTSGRIRIMHGINTTTATQVGYLAFLHDNVASATKLQTARTIWGQSFDGTNNVDGTLRIKCTTSSYQEGLCIQNADSTWCTIRLGNTANSGTTTNTWSIHRKPDNNFSISRNSSDGANGLVMTSTGMGLGTTSPSYRLHVNGTAHANLFHVNDGNHTGIQLGSTYISSLDSNVIFQNNNAIRFGNDAWDYNQWAGLKYDHSNKTIYLGIADGSIFVANKGQGGGTVRLVHCGLNSDNTIYVPYNTLGISFRSTSYTSWGSWVSHQTSGNEALVFGTQNSNTAIMFVNGESYENISNSRFQSLTPGLMIKNNIVQIGYPYDDFNGDYRLRVKGSTFIYGNLHFGSFSDTWIDSNNNSHPWYGMDMYMYKHDMYDICYSSYYGMTIRTNATLQLWSPIVQVTGNLYATGGVTAYQTSDIRLKSNIKTFDYIQTIKSLGNVYEFDYIKDGKHSIGLIAQNVQKSNLADLVDTDDDGYLKLNYWSPKLISLALGGITQIDDEVTRLKARVRELENEVKQLKNK